MSSRDCQCGKDNIIRGGDYSELHPHSYHFPWIVWTLGGCANSRCTSLIYVVGQIANNLELNLPSLVKSQSSVKIGMFSLYMG